MSIYIYLVLDDEVLFEVYESSSHRKSVYNTFRQRVSVLDSIVPLNVKFANTNYRNTVRSGRGNNAIESMTTVSLVNELCKFKGLY